MDTMPMTSPSSTTGRWRNPLSSIVLRASSTCSSGLTVLGSCVIHDSTWWDGASCDCEIARTVSRSVKMPASRVPSMTIIEPTRCWAISATASPTVDEGLTVYSVSLMTSRTVAMTRSLSLPWMDRGDGQDRGRGQHEEHHQALVPGRLRSAPPHQRRHGDHDHDPSHLRAQNQAVLGRPQVAEASHLGGGPERSCQGCDRERQEGDAPEPFEERPSLRTSPPPRRKQRGQDQDAPGPHPRRENVNEVHEDRAAG